MIGSMLNQLPNGSDHLGKRRGVVSSAAEIIQPGGVGRVDKCLASP